MNFEPLGDRVVILPDEKVYREKSDGGIDLIPGDEKEAQSGVIYAIGDGVEPTGRISQAYWDGKRVVYSPWTGFALTLDGQTYKILNEGEIMGILTDSEAQVEVA
ncbi:hypothetical protein LCGC14_3072210 [marine sediment metagenome]|uniref:10 kDa chaperonin n=1 Tax=marine sediment metagenome TaxID=412755 RepID=A0A0F8WFQ1_9ZZZZ